MFMEIVYWIYKLYVFYPAYNGSVKPNITILYLEEWSAWYYTVIMSFLLYCSNVLPTVFMLTILRVFYDLGQKDSLMQSQVEKSEG